MSRPTSRSESRRPRTCSPRRSTRPASVDSHKTYQKSLKSRLILLGGIQVCLNDIRCLKRLPPVHIIPPSVSPDFRVILLWTKRFTRNGSWTSNAYDVNSCGMVPSGMPMGMVVWGVCYIVIHPTSPTFCSPSMSVIFHLFVRVFFILQHMILIAREDLYFHADIIRSNH